MVQEKKQKIDFQGDGHLGLTIGIILAIFDLQVTPMLPTNFKSIGLSVKEMLKIDFKDGDYGGHLGFPIRTILAIFEEQVTPMLSTKFQVNWPFGSGEAQNRF